MTRRPGEPAGYGEMIRALNAVHYAGETAFYATAPLRPCEQVLSERLADGVRVLDVGCGAGRVITRVGRRQRADVMGVDVNVSALRAARACRPDVAVVQGTMASLPVAPARFDHVWCLRFSFNALPTAAERFETLRELWRVCHRQRHRGYATWLVLHKPASQAVNGGRER